MKILHVIDMISQYKAGGSAKVPYQLSKEQARLGHLVSIYTSDYEAEGQQPPPGVNLHKFHCVLNLLGGVKVTPSMALADFKQFDIIHLHNYRTLVNIITAIKGAPCVLQAHGSCLPIHSLTNSLHNFIWRNFIMKQMHGFIADAEMEIAQYMSEGAARKNIHMSSVGIDYKEFTKLPSRQKRTKKRVLFLGRLHPMKGIDLLVRAFKLIDREDITLVIAGVDYGYEAELHKLISELGIGDRVEYLGEIHGADKVREYTNADVYVMPSRYEMFGLSLIEALACGTPAIITDTCGIAPILPSECGIVIPFDEWALAKAISKTLDNNHADIYRPYRIKWAKQYDWKKLAPQVIKVYEEVLTATH